MRYGSKLASLIDRENTTAEAVAEVCGVSPATVGRWINRGAIPRLDEAAAAANHFCVSLDSMVDDDVDEPIPRDSPADHGVVLTSDERTIIDVYRDLRLDRAPVVEAMNAISSRRMLAAGEMISSTGDASYRDGTTTNPSGTGTAKRPGAAATSAGLPPFGERRRS